MATPCDVIAYRAEFKDQVLALQTHLWSPDVALNRQYLAWKYEANPYIGEPLIYLARCDGRIVGMRGAFGAQWEIGQPTQRFVAPYIDDLVILPAYRDRGLYTRIMRTAFTDLATRGYEYAFNLSGGRVTVLGSLAMGWKSAGVMQPVGRRGGARGDWSRLRAQVNMLPGLRRYRSAAWLYSRHERQPFRNLDLAVRRRGSMLAEGIHVERAPRVQAMADLVDSLGYDGRLRQVRDARFFAWRFLNPLSDYRFLYAVKDGRLLGYLVLQHRAVRRVPRVHIADWEAGSVEVCSALLRAAIEQGQFPELVIWSATLDEARRSLLEASDFRPVDEELTSRGHPCALVRPVRIERLEGPWEVAGRELRDFSNWDLRMIYAMSA
jgi:GNAT superfamily N-acetyltransferase